MSRKCEEFGAFYKTQVAQKTTQKTETVTFVAATFNISRGVQSFSRFIMFCTCSVFRKKTTN